MDTKSSLLYEKNILCSDEISISPNIEIVTLYSHFMQNTHSEWNFNLHSHSFHELHIAFKGNFSICFQDNNIYLPESSFILIPPHTEHKFMQCSDDLFRFSLAFDMIFNQNQLITAAPPAVLPLNNNCTFYIENILSEYKENKTGCKNITGSLTNCLIIELLRISDAINLHTTPKHPNLSKALLFIENNLLNKITVQNVADAVYLSVRQLNRIFFENIGMTAAGYMKLKKINKIKEYLTKTNLSIKEIAFLTGMESDCSLCKIFKRETGVSPTAYRASVHNHK